MLAFCSRMTSSAAAGVISSTPSVGEPGELAAVAVPLAVAEGEDVLVVEGPAVGLVQPVLGDGVDLGVAHEDALHPDRAAAGRPAGRACRRAR